MAPNDKSVRHSGVVGATSKSGLQILHDLGFDYSKDLMQLSEYI